MELRFEKPIFIVGCTNAGTKCLFYTLLEHPELGGVKKELHFYGLQPNLDGRLNRLFALFPCFNSNWAHPGYFPSTFGTGPLSRGEVEQTIREVYRRLPSHRKEGKRFIAKDPKLSLRVRWLKSLWPDAHIVCMVRNPWAVAEGIRRRLPIMGDVALNLDIPTATAQWINTYTSIMVDAEGIEDFYVVRYEDMIRAGKFPDSTEANCFWGRLLAHLGLRREGFEVPNKTKYSVFEKDRNKESLENLSIWERKFISKATKNWIEYFGYEEMGQEVEAMNERKK